MTLAQILAAIGEHEKELVVFNGDADGSLVEKLREYFRTQNVRIRAEVTASRAPADVAVLAKRGAVLSIVSASTLRGLLEDVPSGADAVGIADGDYEPILGYLKETTFTSHDTEQMLYTTREIEDRARRVRAGTIHAGFQRLSLVADQQSIYADLAGRGVDVHVYGVPDAPSPEIDGGDVHGVENDEIAETWFVAFDGGGEDGQKCALLAEERSGGTFDGAWTYDPTIVDSVLEHLEATYLSADRTRTQSGT